jgi:bla regulator protein BlaR1
MPPCSWNCRRALLLAGLASLGGQCWLAHGQLLHAPGERPSFEVATVKPWQRPPTPPPDGASAPVKIAKLSPVGAGGQPTSRVHMILPAALLIASAYNLPVGSENRRVKGPDWLRDQSDQYEIQAKIDDSVFAAMQKMTPAQQREQVALMEQSLLADRFKLHVHFEMLEMPVYVLVVAKGGTKLTIAENREPKLSAVRDEQGMKMTANAVTLDQFALSPLLTGSAGRMVLDQTGISGAYDFTVRWNPEEIAAASEAPSFFTALQEQLGLRLIPSKAPVEIIVVDHIERPSPN